MILKDAAVERIVQKVQEQFPTFGGAVKGDGWNPVTAALEGQPAQFAAGVPVAEVVKLVALEIGKMLYGTEERTTPPPPPHVAAEPPLDVAEMKFAANCRQCGRHVPRGGAAVWQRRVAVWCTRACFNEWQQHHGR